MVYDVVIGDLSPAGGAKDQSIIDGVVQEIDLESGAVLFEWHALADVPVTESQQPLPPDAKHAYDYVHLNSIALDHDGDVLVSARHTSAVYSIDRETGVLEWTLGGENSDFEMGAGTVFGWQHDARRQPDGTLSIFDNAASNLGQSGTVSRLLLLDVDEQARTATLRGSYARGVLATSQGNAQRVPDGDYVVGWGDQPRYTVFTPTGDVVYEATMPEQGEENIHSYRTFRHPWQGEPPTDPKIVTRVEGGAARAYVSWNGATEVRTWEVLAGPADDALVSIASAPRAGFETAITLPDFPAAFLAVRALGAAGKELGRSEPIRADG
jgi:hypothetical protein